MRVDSVHIFIVGKYIGKAKIGESEESPILDGEGTMISMKASKVMNQQENLVLEPVLIDRNDGHLKTPEPKKW